MEANPASNAIGHSCQDQVNTPYLPASKNPFSLEVVTPCNMGFEVQKALHEIQRINGDIDTYVRIRLGYPNNQALYQRLSAEQIDATAMAINQIERGEALIIGDQTGIGKGRVAASVIRYAVNQGKVPVFITEKSNLFSDIYRDLVDIGSESLRPFIFNTDSKARIMDESGDVVYTPLAAEGQKSELESTSSLPQDYDFIATTYSQLSGDQLAIQAKEKFLGTQQKKRKTFSPQYKTQFLRAIADNAIFILDESHNAGGSTSTIGFFIREIITQAQGVVYLSATFAKRPDNMPTYGIRTALKEANLDQSALIRAVNKGGTALQEIIASELVSVGQMVRRQRTYDGIKVIYRELKQYKAVHTQVYNAVTEIVRAIIDFQKEYIDDLIQEMDEVVRENGGSAQNTKGTRGAGVDNVTYFSKVHLVTDQLLFALKAEQVADLAIELLAQNKKPVIAFKNTMGSFLESMGYTDGDLVENIDFALTLQGALEGIMKYTTRNDQGISTTEKIAVEELGYDAGAAYEDIAEKIKSVSSGITISPIDIIIERIEQTPRAKGVAGKSPYYTVAEVTGRKQRIVTEDELPVVRKFKSTINKSFRAFNNGEIDVVLINQTGATGGSLHSSAKFGDKRQRAMIIHQMELNINTEMQKRGRVNRTGQVNKPEYYYLTTSIPAEKRLMMAAKAKLKSLDANTTASQHANESQLEQVDFFNKYGGEVIAAYLRENKELDKRLGDPIGKVNSNKNDQDDNSGEVSHKKGIKLTDIPKKVTGRVAILPVADQELFYTKVLQKYLDYVDELKRKDEYDLEAEFVPLEAKTLDKYIAIGGTGGYSSFGGDAYLETVSAKNTRKPYKMSSINEMIKKTLNGMSVEEYHHELLDYFKYSYPKVVEKKLTPVKIDLEELEEKQAREQERLVAQAAAMDEAEKKYHAEEEAEKKQQLEEKFVIAKGKWSRTSGNLDARATKIMTTLQTIKDRKEELDTGKTLLTTLFNDFYPSRIFSAPIQTKEDELVASYAIFLGFDIDRDLSNPFAPSNLKMMFAFSDTRVYAKSGYNSGMSHGLIPLNKEEEKAAKAKWNSMGSNDYVRVGIVTGNIITAINNAQFNGKIIKYSTHDGKIKAGLVQKKVAKPDETKGVKPIGSALEDVLSLEMGAAIESAGVALRIENSNQIFYTCYMSSNKLHEKFYKDEELRQLLQGTPEEVQAGELASFRKAGGPELKGEIPKINIKKFVQRLHNAHKVMVESDSLQKVAIDSEPQAAAGQSNASTYRYELSSVFSSRTQPSQGLIDHVLASGSTYGHVIYHRELTDKERYEYGLIPIYASTNEIYSKWKQALTPAIKAALKQEIKRVQRQVYPKAVAELGSFIANHPHESGNYEFIFGKFSEKELGEMLYQDQIGERQKESELDLIKRQLDILLSHH